MNVPAKTFARCGDALQCLIPVCKEMGTAGGDQTLPLVISRVRLDDDALSPTAFASADDFDSVTWSVKAKQACP